MIIEKRKLIWILAILPFFKPDCLIGTQFSALWNYWQYAGIIVCLMYTIKNIRDIKQISPAAWMLVAYYFFQVIATYMNKLEIYADILTFIKYSCMLICTAICVQKYGWEFTSFIYKVVKFILIVNFVTSILFYENGISQDMYGNPIYFWSTKNHIVGVIIVAFAIGGILLQKQLETRKGYLFLLVIGVSQVLILRSSTAIIATAVFLIFLLLDKYYTMRKKTLNIKNVLIVGGALQILFVVYRVQDHFESLILLLFGKTASLSERTDLWDQALKIIPSNWVWGLGNATSAGQSGWLTGSQWNALMHSMDSIYYVAHNQFLEILLNGGVFCLLAFVSALIFSAINIAKIKNRHSIVILAAAIFSYFIVMVVEVLYPYPPVWIFLIIISVLHEHDTIQEVNCYE